jgi:hypothetical protein
MTQIRSILVFIVILIGAGVTFWGLSQIPWPTALPSIWNSLRYYIIFWIFGAVTVEASARLLRIGRFYAACLIAGLIAIVTGAIWPLLVNVWFALASFALGRIISSIFKIDKERLSGLTTFLIGAGAYGSVVSLLSHFPINYPGLYGIALAIPVVFEWSSIKVLVRSLCECIPRSDKYKWLDLTISFVALTYFSVALMPEVGVDALAMHLFVPAQLALRHEWGFDVTTYVWAVMPMLGDWLYSIAYMLAGEKASRMLNVCFLFVVSRLIRDLVIWAGGTVLGARWAILLFLTTPLAFTESSSLYVETIWASFVVAGSLAIFKALSSENDPKTYLPVAAFLLGGALAAKAVTFTFLPVILLLLVLRYRVWLRVAFIPFLGGSFVLFLLVGTIPYITAWYLTGNPVFPFFNKIFQSPFYPVINFEATTYGKGVTWDIFYQVIFHSEKFLEGSAGAAGFQWLLLFWPALLFLSLLRHRRGGTLFVVGILSVVLAFYSTAYLRYVFPAFGFVCAGIGVGMSQATNDSSVLKRVFFMTGCITIGLNLFFFKSGTWCGDLMLHPLVSPAGREEYILNRRPIRKAVELVNRLNIWKSPVAVFSGPYMAGLNTDALYPTWYNHRFQTLVKTVHSTDELINLLVNEGVDYVILDSNWRRVKWLVDKREFIDEATVLLAEYKTIAVRKLKRRHQYQKELLVNPSFSGNHGWFFSGALPEQSGGGIIVSSSSPAKQKVSVVPGKHYLKTLTASCAIEQTQGRIQVNWLDEDSSLISTDIRIFDCIPKPVFHTMEVVAPHGAVNAVVYATGHTEKSLVIHEVSFKK